MPTNSTDVYTTILLIDGNATDRSYFAKQLTDSSSDYLIIEAADGPSGLALYRSQRIDCVVLVLGLPDLSGIRVLLDLVPIVRKPKVAVIALSRLEHAAALAVAKQHGAQECFIKEFTTGAMLDKSIQRSMEFVGLLPKEDRQRPL
jgi:phosphoserine phosphatase RsbU/P